VRQREVEGEDDRKNLFQKTGDLEGRDLLGLTFHPKCNTVPNALRSLKSVEDIGMTEFTPQ